MNIIKRIVGFILNISFGMLPIKENRIFFETCNGEVKDHLKSIYVYCKKNNIESFEFYWAINKGNDVSMLPSREVVFKKSLRYYYILMTSQYWVRTHSVDNIVKKRSQQSYIQLWHGPGATKKEGFDLGIHDDGLPLYHTREWDYFIATDHASYDYIKSATHIQIPRIMLGSCRTDELYNASTMYCKQLRLKYGILENETVVLYAPTFRDKDLETDIVHLPIRSLCMRPKTRVILRLHPFIKNKLNLSEYGDQVIRGDEFSEINDLLLISDFLITDYSSVAIDYSILRRPILYYAYDIAEYNIERGFYFDYMNHLSGPLIKTEEELLYTIDNWNEIAVNYKVEEKKYFQRYNEFNNGHVCEKFVNKLLNKDFSKM